MEEIKQQLKDFIVDELGVDPSGLRIVTHLFGEGIGLDSIDSIEIISFVDETFGVSMNGVDKTNFLSIDTIAAYVADHQ